MNASAKFLRPAEAARALGVSAKALRLYEARGLIAPGRTAAGWRSYSPQDLARAGEVAALRRLGLGLAEIAEALAADTAALGGLLARHEARLADQRQEIASRIERIRALRREAIHADEPVLAFDLPWPWDGARFALPEIARLTWITGPLFSGKTRLAQKIAETLPGARFLGLDRMRAEIDAARIASARAKLVAAGASPSPALDILLTALLAAGDGALVIDMVEEGLDAASQQALARWLRADCPVTRPLFLMTRSDVLLDLSQVGPEERILFCPANHTAPQFVTPQAGSPGYEALASCLATPEARARTAGVVAIGRDVA